MRKLFRNWTKTSGVGGFRIHVETIYLRHIYSNTFIKRF